MNVAEFRVEPLPERRKGNPEIALQFCFNSVDRSLIMGSQSSSATTIAPSIFSESGWSGRH